jgi:hypothetical protein
MVFHNVPAMHEREAVTHCTGIKCSSFSSLQYNCKQWLPIKFQQSMVSGYTQSVSLKYLIRITEAAPVGMQHFIIETTKLAHFSFDTFSPALQRPC